MSPPASTLVTPKVLAAAWTAWRSRHRGQLGPGPGFAEALAAGLAAALNEGSIVITRPAETAVPDLDIEATNVAVEMVEAFLSRGPGFRGPFEDFCEIVEPIIRDAIGSARRDGVQLALSAGVDAAAATAMRERCAALVEEICGPPDRRMGFGGTENEIARRIRAIPGKPSAAGTQTITIGEE